MRHVLDHYSSFLAGIDSGVVNYDARVRETLVETDRVSGIEQAKSIVERLKSSVVDTSQTVKVIVSANTTEDEVHSVSSVGRELQFLASHTVHHYRSSRLRVECRVLFLRIRLASLPLL